MSLLNSDTSSVLLQLDGRFSEDVERLERIANTLENTMSRLNTFVAFDRRVDTENPDFAKNFTEAMCRRLEDLEYYTRWIEHTLQYLDKTI